MVDLYDELGDVCEGKDENFIFLDEQGQALLKQKLFFKWADFVNVSIFLVCCPDDSISYVKTLLCVSLEKYPICAGLKSLKIKEILTNKEQLPDKGSIGLYIQPDQEFMFRVNATEIWLEVELQLKDLLAVLFFEIKVQMETKLLSIRKFVTELLNSVLKTQNSPVELVDESIRMQEIRMSEEEFNGYDLKGMLLNKHSKVKGLENVEYENCVKDYFDIKNRFLLCAPPGKSIGVGGRKSALREVYGPTFLQGLQSFDFGFGVRNASFVSKGFNKKQKPMSGQIKKKVSLKEKKSEACNCVIY